MIGLNKIKFFKICSILLALMVVFIIGESILRISILYKSSILKGTKDVFNLYQHDEFLGWKGKPKVKEWMNNGIQNYFVQHNSEGFRDRNYQMTKKIPRIVILGDSFTWGFGVEAHQRFSNILERDYFNNRVEVINLGICGYGTDQEYLMLKNYGFSYNPDLVILMFQISSDLIENMSSVQYKQNKPYYIFKNGNLTLKKNSLSKQTNNSCQDITESSAKNIVGSIKSVLRGMKLYLLVVTKIRQNCLWLSDVLIKIGVMEPYPILKPDNGLYIFNQYYSTEWEEGWNVTKALIKKIKYDASLKKIKFVLVLIPDNLQVDGSEFNDFIKTYRSEKSLIDIDKPNTILSRFAKRNNIYVLDLLPAFRYVANEGEKTYFRIYDRHWNNNGHALAAKFIYDYIVEKDDIFNSINKTRDE
ncbi:MAG: SGNH/GDSL hydrolase family protein [bacterium]